MLRFHYVVGGSIGSDPRSPRTWSGTSRRIVQAAESLGVLASAVGVTLPRAEQLALFAKNFSPNRSVWRQKLYMDPAYRNRLTHAARSLSLGEGPCLQIGSSFNLAQAFPGIRTYAYQDGNLAVKQASAFPVTGVPARRIDEALAYEAACAREMTGILTFSHYLAESFVRDYGVVREKVHVVGGAINFDEMPEPNPARDFASGKILFVGAEFERKGGPALLKAFAIARQRFPHAELHIAGPSALPQLPAGVVFHGHLSRAVPEQRAKLEELYRTAAFFVLPSLYEPYGIAPLEAMAYGMPCLLTDDWALREHVEPGVHGALAAKGSVEDLALQMEAMLADPESLRQMGANARAKVAAEYRWEDVVRRITTRMQQDSM